MKCPGECKEEFFVLGHELFEEAQQMQQGMDRIPGLVIPHFRTPG